MTRPGTMLLADGSGEEDEEDEDNGVEVECEHCGYVWVYSGKMWTATCPRCNRKTPTGLKPDDFDD